MDNKNYTSENLIMDDSFIRWVRSGFSEENEKWQEMKRRSSDPAKFEEAIRVVQLLRFKKSEVSIDRADLWNKIDLATDSTPQHKTGRRRVMYTLLAAAAAILLFLIAFPGIWNGSTIIQSNEISEHVLPDDSSIQLGLDTRIKYAKNYSENRSIHLRGEAFFKVEKGSPFIVETNLGRVEVLGTSFNVYSRNEYFSVKCRSGKVRVIHNGEESILGPSQMVEYEGELKLSNNLFDAQTADEWFNGLFRYKDSSLDRVFDEVERQFEVKIETTPEIGNLRYSGYFETKDLEEALYSVCWPMKLEYQKNGNRIQIRTSVQK